jgi:hypothetical protein
MPVARVTSIVELIQARMPDVLAELRRSHPDSLDLLSEGLVMGDKAMAPGSAVYCALARSGLQVAHKEIADILRDLPLRARYAKRIRLIGSIVAALMSAGVVTSAIFSTKEVTIITALLSFVVTVGGSAASYLETPLFGANGIAELTEECLRLEMEAQKAEFELQFQLSMENADCINAATTVNDICAKLRRLSVFGDVNRS